MTIQWGTATRDNMLALVELHGGNIEYQMRADTAKAGRWLVRLGTNPAATTIVTEGDLVTDSGRALDPKLWEYTPAESETPAERGASK